ncbi:uncharacterized protein [Palaemon carinicauda]
MKLLISIAFVLLLFVQAGIALECYSCDGEDMCSRKVSCRGSCAKKHDFDDDEDVRRYCSETREQVPSKHEGGDDEQVTTFFCNTDLCNGSSPVATNHLATAASTVALVVVAAAFGN